MKQIKLSDNHYIVVDETQEIKQDDWCLDFDNKRIYQSKTNEHKGIFQKITHSTQPIDTVAIENDERAYKLYPLSLAKEIAGEVDVNEKAYKYAIDYRCPATNDQEYCKHDIIAAYNNGYNQCLEDNKDKKYTEEDLRNVIRIYSHA